MKLFIPIMIFIHLFYPIKLWAQPLQPEGSARSAAMGQAGLFSGDVFAGTQNQANLAHLRHPYIGSYASRHFLIPELQTHILSAATPLSYGILAGTFTYTGVPAFHETKSGLAFGKKISKNASAGMQLNYFHRYMAEQLSPEFALSGEGGVHCKISDKIAVAGHVFNPFQFMQSSNEPYFKFSSVKLGVNYQPDTSLSLILETEQNTLQAFLVKTGLEWEAAPQFYLRTGYQVMSGLWGMGTGFSFDRFHANLSATLHPFLGVSPHFSLIYAFNKKTTSRKL